MKNTYKNTYRGRFGNKKAICGVIIAAGMAVITGCGANAVTVSGIFCTTGEIPEKDEIWDSKFTEPDSILAATNVLQTASEKSESVMGSVPYFRDDAGKNTQTADGYLYGYWNNRLCRYDLETLEETVLYEAVSPQRGDFCIWGDYVYFMVLPNVNAVGKLHGYLYRVPCDGSEEAVCLASVAMPGQNWAGGYEYYKLDTYEDVLYLMQQYSDEENLYFRLNQDGSIVRIEESETLYGKLPEGDYSRWRNGTMITLPYAMRNYGYVFMQDEDDTPVRIDLDSQQIETMDALKDYRIYAVTNDAVIASKSNVWYRLPLDDIDELREIGKLSSDRGYYAAWDAKGLYFTSLYEGYGTVYFMDWEGEETILHSYFPRKQQIEYFDKDYYYYVTERREGDVIKRLELKGGRDAEPEEVAVYKENPYWDIAVRECFDYGWTDVCTGANVDYSITKVLFKEDTGAFGRINDFLENLYKQDIDSMEDFKKAVMEESEETWEEWGAEYVEYGDSYDVCYMDERYVGIANYWDQYWKGGAHGIYGTIYYMFDRNTGKRVSITEVVNDSPEEICEIIAPYVETVAAWGTDDEDWETTLLEVDRFFLSEEGIGIHFDVYEIDCYAAGESEIIVPYSMFDLRER